MKPGELVQLSVDSLTLDGEGLARNDGLTVSCRGVFPSEVANVRVTAISRHHPRAHAALTEITRPHSARRSAPCPNHERREGRCAGCGLMELDESAQRLEKARMLHDLGLPVQGIEAAPESLGYRYSSKRVAFATRRGLVLGSYAYRSHTPAPMPSCLVDHPLLVAAFAAVERSANALAIEPYDERREAGDLRYVWAKTNEREVIVTLVTARSESRVGELSALLSPPIAGLLHSVQGGRGNSLRGDRSRQLAGSSEIHIELLDQRVEVGALGFVQPNRRVAEAAYRELLRLDEVHGRELAFDLYAGSGITTRVLARSFAQVEAAEAHPESARALGTEAERAETFLARQHAAGRTPDLVVGTPPRKGLGPEACERLLMLGAPRVHVMSCGPEGLVTDLDRLAARYDLEELKAFDTLPQTPHVELVARLRLR